MEKRAGVSKVLHFVPLIKHPADLDLCHRERPRAAVWPSASPYLPLAPIRYPVELCLLLGKRTWAAQQ